MLIANIGVRIAILLVRHHQISLVAVGQTLLFDLGKANQLSGSWPLKTKN